jgi:anti-sigma regulatory factor (Ser/Thr protein kinase)
MTNELAASFPPSRQTPAATRTFVRAALQTWAMDGVGEVVELLATELVSNVVSHVGSSMTVRVSRRAGSVRVEVDDASDQLPVMRDPSPTDRGGRGLLIIDRLARSWGAERRDGGKTVWFEVAEPI